MFRLIGSVVMTNDAMTNELITYVLTFGLCFGLPVGIQMLWTYMKGLPKSSD